MPSNDNDTPDLPKLAVSLLNIISSCQKSNVPLESYGWLNGVAYILGGHEAANELADSMMKNRATRICHHHTPRREVPPNPPLEVASRV